MTLLAAAVWWGGPLAVERIARNSAEKKLSAEDIKMHEWLENTQIDVRNELANVKPLPKDLIEKSRKLWRHWRTLRNDREFRFHHELWELKDRSRHDPASEESLAFHATISPECAELIPLFFDLIRDPNFQVEALMFGETATPEGDYPEIETELFTPIFSLTRMRIAALTRQGNLTEAIQMSTDLICGAKTHPYSTIICQIVAIRMSADGTRMLDDAKDSCDDPAILREALSRIDDCGTGSQDFIQEELPLSVGDSIGMWTTARYGGAEIRYQPGNGSSTLGAGRAAQADYLEQVALPMAGEDPQAREAILEHVNRLRSIAAMYDPERHAKFGTEGLKSRYANSARVAFASINNPNFTEVLIREKVALQRIELLRVELAKQIYLLEHDAPPEDWNAWFVEILGSAPLDRFLEPEAPLSFTSEGEPYSIGPDEDDDGGLSVYDPTNGSLSDGDLFLLRPSDSNSESQN